MIANRLNAIQAKAQNCARGLVSRNRRPTIVPGQSAEAARPNAKPGASGTSLYSSHKVIGMDKFNSNCPISDSAIFLEKKHRHIAARGMVSHAA